jgi:flagellar basal body-associated protein FliL
MSEEKQNTQAKYKNKAIYIIWIIIIIIIIISLAQVKFVSEKWEK